MDNTGCFVILCGTNNLSVWNALDPLWSRETLWTLSCNFTDNVAMLGAKLLIKDLGVLDDEITIASAGEEVMDSIRLKSYSSREAIRSSLT